MNQQLGQSVIAALPDLTLVVRRDGIIVSTLGGHGLSLARNPADLAGKPLAELWGIQIAGELRKLVVRTLKSRGSMEWQFAHQVHQYTVRIKPQGVDRVLMIIRERASAAAESTPVSGSQTSHTTASDPLSEFAQAFNRAVGNARLREVRLALGIVHLGGLRELTWALGPASADRLVSELTTQIAALDRTAACGRQEADLLGVLWEDVSGHAAAAVLADRVREVVAADRLHEGKTATLVPSVGVALYPGDGRGARALFESARTAALGAHFSGRTNAVTFCSDTVPLRLLARPDFEQELRWALEHEQFELRYLPVMALTGRRVTAAQTALRWTHPVIGPVPPEKFLPLLATMDLQTSLDRWLMTRACQQFAHYLASPAATGADTLRLSVRPGRQFVESEQMTRCIRDALAASELPAWRLVVEIDLRSLAGGSRVRSRFRDLRQQGVCIQLDDFGSESVPLARLAHLPVDAVKIPQDFVSRIERDRSARSVCGSLIAVARAFGLKCCAAGVETRAQLEFLDENQCDQAQGPIFGDPTELSALVHQTP